ncbi:MAG: vWA domain-containing protein [Pirellulaceae bacterium]|nr:vWA domain-containing protein [Pirellulaceae bacterium]
MHNPEPPPRADVAEPPVPDSGRPTTDIATPPVQTAAAPPPAATSSDPPTPPPRPAAKSVQPSEPAAAEVDERAESSSSSSSSSSASIESTAPVGVDADDADDVLAAFDELDESSDGVEVVETTQAAERWWHAGDSKAVGISALFHLLFLLGMAFCVIPILVGGDEILIEALLGDEADEGELESLEITQSLEPEQEMLDSDFVDPEPSEIPDPAIEFPLEPKEEIVPEAPAVAVESGGAPAEAKTIESAVDGVTGEILGELEKGDLLVVWLLDASHSLVDDRKRVAARLEPFFDSIRERLREKSDANELRNAVVSFGANIKQRVPPTPFGDRIVKAVENLPIDESGKENVFSAIARCTVNYRKSWRDKAVMIVVWTDETGDDGDLLEKTIDLCAAQKVKVSVVGPSSVLGADTGLHAYVDPKSKKFHLLPVDRGPDSARPERLQLGYWFLPRLPGRRGESAITPSWYGGPDLKGVASGFSPYTLTRLARESGGSYTIFDREEDRGPFSAERLRAYAPSYGTLSEYNTMISSHPLRAAVMAAVAETEGAKLGQPETVLFVKRNAARPEEVVRPYMTPAQFASQLKVSRRVYQQRAERMARVVERALQEVSLEGDPSRPLTALFEQETSPRWRAWYQLTRGRLLAASVRLEEYQLALDAFAEPGFLREETNHLVMKPQLRMRSSQKFQARAKEAEQLLMECAEEHANTPWAYLADREMTHGLGLTAQQVILRLVRGRPGSRPSFSKLPKF